MSGWWSSTALGPLPLVPGAVLILSVGPERSQASPDSRPYV